MSKGPWKKRKNSPDVDPGIKLDSPAPILNGDSHPSDILPPLPPLSPLGSASPNPGPPAGGAPSPAAPFMDSNKLGIAKVFVSSTKAVENILNLSFSWSPYSFQLKEVSQEEGELWAEFALPVLKKYFPKFEQQPEWVLAVVTVGILGGKLKIIKRVTEAPNVGSEGKIISAEAESHGNVS